MIKKAMFTLHLWLGMASGLLFTLVCCTGFFLGLQPRLEAYANRPLKGKANVQAPSLAPDQLLASAQNAATSPLDRLEIPDDESDAWRVRSKTGSLYIDPHSGDVYPPLWGDSYNTIKKLHRWLLLDSKVGRPITGAAALVYLAILLSGACLWLSKCYKKPGRGLSFKRGTHWRRTLYDAHLVFGMYALIPLFIMASTGLWWSYREPYKAVVYNLLDGAGPPQQSPKKEKSDEEATPTRLALPYPAILAQMESELPYSGTIRLQFPRLGAATLTVSKTRAPGFWCLPIKDELVFDANSGQLIDKKLFAGRSRAEKFTSLIFDIHAGNAWGGLTLILWLLATIAGATLPITGTFTWWNRMKSQRKSREILAKRRQRDRN